MDYVIWDELSHEINREKVESKETWIDELNRAVATIRTTMAFESCLSWTTRLHHVYQKNADYFRK